MSVLTIHTIIHSLFYENIYSFDKSDGLQISVVISKNNNNNNNVFIVV